MRFAPLLAPLFYANLAFLCDKISLRRRGTFRHYRNRARYFLRVLCEKTLRTLWLNKKETTKNTGMHEVRKGESVPNPFNLCSPCAIEEESTQIARIQPINTETPLNSSLLTFNSKTIRADSVESVLSVCRSSLRAL